MSTQGFSPEVITGGSKIVPIESLLTGKQLVNDMTSMFYGLNGPAQFKRPRLDQMPYFEGVHDDYDANLGAIPEKGKRAFLIRYNKLAADSLLAESSDSLLLDVSRSFLLGHITAILISGQAEITKQITENIQAGPETYEHIDMRWRLAGALAIKTVAASEHESVKGQRSEEADLREVYRRANRDVHEYYAADHMATTCLMNGLNKELPISYCKMPPPIKGILTPLTDEMLVRFSSVRI